MNKKLLHKTSRAYLLFSILILLVSAPLFYFVTRQLYIKEADDTLNLHKKEFLKYSAPVLKKEDIPTWNRFNRNVKIKECAQVKQDSIYTAIYYDTLDAEWEPYRELTAPVTINGKPYTYVARMNLVESEDLMKSHAFLFFSIIVVLLTGLFLITRRLSLSLWKPFYETLKQIESFEIDKSKSPSFRKTGIEEFNRLHTSIQKLIERNTIIYKSQREFIENAAHELQTPLAIFQAKIDTLIQSADVTWQQSEILASLNENVSRLHRLNNNLLLLSKIENNIYSDKQTIPLKGCVQKNLDFFTEQSKGKHLIIKTAFTDEESVIQSNPVLAEILISNLFLNAIKHNVEGGEILVSVSENKLVFANTSHSIALDTNKLFNRFFKGNPHEQGTGLGLSIVKKIAGLNDWKVSYHFANQLHFFSVSF